MPPIFTLIAGPNGAGKSTSAPALLPSSVPYINADEIAKVIGGAHKDIRASRMLLNEWDRLEALGEDFAIETTLASRSVAPKIRQLQAKGYRFTLYFFWLPSADLAVARVAERVRAGGHDIPEETIRRRHASGVRNFFELYQPIADHWAVFTNTPPAQSLLVAQGKHNEQTNILEIEYWDRMLEASTMKSDTVRESVAYYNYGRTSIEIEQAVQQAARKAVLDHKRAGNPIAVWRDDKVVIVPPEEIVVPDEVVEPLGAPSMLVEAN